MIAALLPLAGCGCEHKDAVAKAALPGGTSMSMQPRGLPPVRPPSHTCSLSWMTCCSDHSASCQGH